MDMWVYIQRKKEECWAQGIVGIAAGQLGD